MTFQPIACNMIQRTRKHTNKINAEYNLQCLEETNLQNFDKIKNLGVTITEDLRWNAHVSNICTEANRTFDFLRRNLYPCPQDVKETAYKGLGLWIFCF